eukprot:CAMPEP_0185734282 /NCGR_PEP_ID=MMETSP1171-20130828/22022_1 /TAXON_ID=374046 /ORGANISM="Helicotheca tamensis, Strain CCMP826" /LENGTH=229 /DNA_ID=CAMNT_0028404241 /DNA_START=44 /DNA_END=729 /DNA_ORIENTATION=-
MPPDPMSPGGAAIHPSCSFDEDDPPQLSGYMAKLNEMMHDNQRDVNIGLTRVGSSPALSSLPLATTFDMPLSMSAHGANCVPLRGSIMSARSLEQSLEGDSYREAARNRRLRRSSSSILDDLSHDDELSVSFCSVEVREYGVQLGDNPGVSAGPPLTIEWEHFNEEKIDIDAFESNHTPRRTQREMAIPYKERWRRLNEDANLTNDEIFEGTKAVTVARFNRARTLKAL